MTADAHEPTDEALIQAMAAGHEEALRELHRRHARLLYSLGHRMLKQHDDVESCVQDAFMNAWRHSGRFDPSRASVKTWLVSIAHHRFLQELRDRPEVPLEIEDWDAPTQSADPTDRALAERAVGALNPSQKQLIELAYYRGYSHSELATLTGLPVGTVKSRLRAALELMRGHLGRPAGAADPHDVLEGGERA